MLSTASVHENPILLHQKVLVTVVEPRGEDKPDPVTKELNLRIEERKLDNNEKEFRVEISHLDDFQFLYGDGITRVKFQALADKWGVDSKFEDFFKLLLIPLLKEKDNGQTVHLKCILSADRTLCTFEVVARKEYFIVKMPMELHLVTGDALLQHLMNSVRSLRRNVRGMTALKKELNDVRERKNQSERECEGLRSELEQVNEKLEQAEERISDLEQGKMDAENDLQMARDDGDRQQEDLERLHDQFDGLEEENEQLREQVRGLLEREHNWEEERETADKQMEQLVREAFDSKERVTELQDEVYKLEHILNKYLKPDPTAVSCDDRKLKELESALREKDSTIEQLNASMSELKHEHELTVADLKKTKMSLEEALSLQQKQISFHHMASPSFVPRTSPLGGLSHHPLAHIQAPSRTTMPLTPAAYLPPIVGRGPSTRVPETPLHSRKVHTPILNKMRADIGKTKENVRPLGLGTSTQ